MAGKRANSGDVLREVQVLRKEVSVLTRLLVGTPEEPNMPGLVERVRLLEANDRLVKWAAGIIGTAVLIDVVTRFISLYRGG